MNMEENKLLLKNNPSCFISVFILSLRINGNNIIHKNHFYSTKVGGYYYSSRFKMDSLIKNENIKSCKILQPNYQMEDINEENLFYLKNGLFIFFY